MRPTLLRDLPDKVTVAIEVSRGSIVKRRPDGSVDFVSPLPCPYNYGSVQGTVSDDGDPLDALVLGRRIAYGTRVTVRVRGVVGFVDAGVDDPKLVCAASPLSDRDRRGVVHFFQVYARLKQVLHVLRRHSGSTRCLGWLE